MVAMTSTDKGLSKAAMNPDVEHHKNMVRNVARLEEHANSLSDSLASMETDADFKKQEDLLRQGLNQAATDLAHCGKSKSSKAKYLKMIDEANHELAECSARCRDTKASKEYKTKQLKELNASYQKRLAELKAEQLAEPISRHRTNICGCAQAALETRPAAVGQVFAACQTVTEITKSN